MKKADAIAIVRRRKEMIVAHHKLTTDDKILVLAVLDDVLGDLKNDRLVLRNLVRLRLSPPSTESRGEPG